MINHTSPLWRYLSPEQQGLARDGQILVEDRALHPNEKLSDHSYLVFPFAKLYEGFLKQLFVDMSVISHEDFTSDHFRIGKALSPTMIPKLGNRSAYLLIEKRYGRELAEKLWQTWKQARNLVFHYFPHNFRALTFIQAKERIEAIVDSMETAVTQTHVLKVTDDHIIRYGRHQVN